VLTGRSAGSIWARPTRSLGPRTSRRPAGEIHRIWLRARPPAVDVDDDGEPIVLGEDGSVVDTWRQGCSYQERLRRDDYAQVKQALPIELLKLQNWVKDSGQKLRRPADTGQARS
jgi:hypothetical protein